MPVFNSKQYQWSDVRVVMLGRELTGIQGVKYTQKTEKEYVYGRGSEPLSIQSGNKSVEGSITLLQSELQALVTAVKAVNAAYNLTDVSFDLVVGYGNGSDNATDIIRGVELMEYEKGMDQKAKFMTIELKFMALGVSENA